MEMNIDIMRSLIQTQKCSGMLFLLLLTKRFLISQVSHIGLDDCGPFRTDLNYLSCVVCSGEGVNIGLKLEGLPPDSVTNRTIKWLFPSLTCLKLFVIF